MSPHNNDDDRRGSSSSSGRTARRIYIEDMDTKKFNHRDWLSMFRKQDDYIDSLKRSLSSTASSSEKSPKSVVPKKLSSCKEQFLMLQLSVKDKTIADLTHQLLTLKELTNPPSREQMRCTLVDPAINLLIQTIQNELQEARTKSHEVQEELNAWKFTPDSMTGKRLMTKCRQLLQENEDLGRMIASGRLAKLESQLAMQKALCQEMKKNQVEMDEFVQELDEDVEGMQSTIYFLQQKLREANEKIDMLESSDKKRRSSLTSSTPTKSVSTTKTNAVVKDCVEMFTDSDRQALEDGSNAADSSIQREITET